MTTFFAVSTDEIAARVFLAIAVVVVLARLMGSLARRVGQPAVVGEIIAGILLGPTFVGALPGHLDLRLFPLDIRPYLTVVAQLGLIIFMFIVGLELDVRLVRGKERVAGVVSAVSVALPFSLGMLLALRLYPSYKHVDGKTVDFLAFALFVGASMSVTAFPVLARILTERGMHRTEIGALALACAAVDDVVAWSLLAVVVAIVEAGSLFDLPRILFFSVVFVVIMFLVVRPLLVKLRDQFHHAGRLTPGVLSIVLVGMLLSSYLTWRIGIHALFGAFMFGVIMPKQESADLTHEILERLESVSVLLLLPVFFIVTGLSVDIRGIGWTGLAQLALILLVACVGKFVGASGAARLQGIAPRKAAAVGVLMNTRGLTELVILNVGLAAGVLSPELFTLLVIMAIVTTVMTGPLLRVIYPTSMLEREIRQAEGEPLGRHVTFRVYVPIAEDLSPAQVRDTVGVAMSVAGSGSELVMARLVPLDSRLEIGTGLGSELAAMASTVDELHALAARAEERGVHPVVRSQFTDDPHDELLRQATSLETDVVLLVTPPDGVPGGGWEAVVSALSAGTSDVGEIAWPDEAPAPIASVVLMYGDDPHDAAAAELAARIARSEQVTLEIVGPEVDGGPVPEQLLALETELAALGIATQSPPAGRQVSANRRGSVLTLRGAGNAAVSAPEPVGPSITVWARSQPDGETSATRVARIGRPGGEKRG